MLPFWIGNEKRAQEMRSPGGEKRNRGVAALRERQKKKRRGNDAPWKAWKTQNPKASFPLFPPGLEIRPKPKAPDSHIPTAPATAGHTRPGQTMRLTPNSS